MRIWRLQQLGDPAEQLRLVDEEPPTPKPGEVLVDVEAVGLAFPDVLQCRGQYQVKTGPGFTPGGESAGTVASLGDGVEGIDVGQRVVFLGGGGLAEQVTHPAAAVFPVPDGVSAEVAAAIPINYCTTLYALHDRGHLQAGEWLLVTGAAGGTGPAAIQLGKALGATVIAVAGGEQKSAFCQSIGADHVVDYRKGPIAEQVRERVGSVDIIFDPVGGAVYQDAVQAIGLHGRVALVGFGSGEWAQLDPQDMVSRSYSALGVFLMRCKPEEIAGAYADLFALYENGGIRVPVDKVYRFDEVPLALKQVAGSQLLGKHIVRIAEGG